MALETISAKFQMTMSIDLNEDEFDIQVRGEPRRVHLVKVSLREDGSAHCTAHLRGGKKDGKQDVWNVHYYLLPDVVRSEIKRVWAEHQSRMPAIPHPTDKA